MRSAALKKKTQTQFSTWHTKLKALSFGSLRSSPFNDRPRESIETGGGSAVVCSSEVIRGVGVIMKLCERLCGSRAHLLFFWFNFGWSYLRKYPEFADARLINLMVLYSGNMFEL
jgi:hypothetical protein